MKPSFPPTIIYRHRKENKKKCSLQPLIEDPSFVFVTHPSPLPFIPNNYFILSMEGEELSAKDAGMGILLVDGTWKYAGKMHKHLQSNYQLPQRTLPKNWVTAYPRYQTGCEDPDRGLASIEALYVAYKCLNYPCINLLDHYYWKDDFLKKNLSSESS